MIALDKITLRQGDFELSEVGFELDAGEYGVLMGRSGCGKTTLLEAVCGLRNIESGNIILGDRDVTALPPAERGVGYVAAFNQYLAAARDVFFLLLYRSTSATGHGNTTSQDERD